VNLVFFNLVLFHNNRVATLVLCVDTVETGETFVEICQVLRLA